MADHRGGMTDFGLFLFYIREWYMASHLWAEGLDPDRQLRVSSIANDVGKGKLKLHVPDLSIVASKTHCGHCPLVLWGRKIQLWRFCNLWIGWVPFWMDTSELSSGYSRMVVQAAGFHQVLTSKIPRVILNGVTGNQEFLSVTAPSMYPMRGIRISCLAGLLHCFVPPPPMVQLGQVLGG